MLLPRCVFLALFVFVASNADEAQKNSTISDGKQGQLSERSQRNTDERLAAIRKQVSLLWNEQINQLPLQINQLALLMANQSAQHQQKSRDLQKEIKALQALHQDG